MVSRTVQIDGLLDLINEKNKRLADGLTWLDSTHGVHEMSDIAHDVVSAALQGKEISLVLDRYQQEADMRKEPESA